MYYMVKDRFEEGIEEELEVVEPFTFEGIGSIICECEREEGVWYYPHWINRDEDNVRRDVVSK